MIPLTEKPATLSPDNTPDNCRGGVDASKFSSQDWTLAYRQVLVLKNPAGGKVDAPCAACFDSITWCRVENISPLLKIGVRLPPSAVRLWRLCCRAHDSDARDIYQLFFGRRLFKTSILKARAPEIANPQTLRRSASTWNLTKMLTWA